MTTTATTSGAMPANGVSPGHSSTTAKPDSLAAALAILQTNLPRIGKDKTAEVQTKTGGKYSYKYADLATVSALILPLLGDLGLSFITRPTLRDDGRLVLAYELLHSSGGSMGGTFPLQMARKDDKEPTPQEIGSLITYARRYCLCAVTGAAAEEDDDGRAALEAAVRTKTTVRRRGKIERVLPAGPDPADPWASVDANGERQPPGDLPVTYPPGERQFRALAMHFKRLGYDDDDQNDHEERLVFTAVLAGSGEISSSKELTQDQVKLALGRLGKLKDRTALVDAVLELKESEAAGA